MASHNPIMPAIRKPKMPSIGKPKNRGPLLVCIIIDEPIIKAAMITLKAILLLTLSICKIKFSKPLCSNSTLRVPFFILLIIKVKSFGKESVRLYNAFINFFISASILSVKKAPFIFHLCIFQS